jgi:ketosteroid isomerase-like protein
MKRRLMIYSALFLLAAMASARTIDRQAALDAVVASEHAFAKMAAEKGVKDSFLEYLTDDVVMLIPEPRPAKEWLRSQPATPTFLSWYPIYADISLAGDLGYTTGPSERRAKGKDDPEVGHGFYVTLWKRRPDGSYRAVFDTGTPTDAPASRYVPSIPPARPATVEAEALPKVDVKTALEDLLAADREFAKRAEKGTTAAYAGTLAVESRLHRTGHFPMVGRDAIVAALGKDAEPLTWKPTGGGVAESGDLGYTYGMVQRRENGPQTAWIDAEAYMRIWKKQPDGAWKLVFDVTNPLPPKPPQAPERPAGGGA